MFTYLCRTYFPLECIWRGIVYSVIKVATNRTCTNFCVLSVSESTYLRTWNQHFISMWPLNIQLEEKKEFWIIQLRNPQLNRIQKSIMHFFQFMREKNCNKQQKDLIDSFPFYIAFCSIFLQLFHVSIYYFQDPFPSIFMHYLVRDVKL